MPAAAPAPAPTATIVVAVVSVRPVDPAGLEAVGSAPPGAHVRLRLNNAVLAEVVAGADGLWRLTIERGVTAGDYVLEAAVIDAAGTVLARGESPFVYPQREVVASAAPAASPSPTESPQAAAAEPTPAALAPAAPRPSPTAANVTPSPTAAGAGPTQAAPAPSASAAAAPSPATPAPPAESPAASETPVATAAHAVVPEVLTYTVVKGDNLWDLAVKYYGDGLRYADIFSANASQIRDPNLIYIGQIFVVPPKPTTNPPPAR
jgi:nucleoid-associated protein YgaU